MRYKIRLVRGFAVAHDILASIIAFYLGKISVYGTDFLFASPDLKIEAPLFFVIATACLYVSGLNRGSWRYASIPDLAAIIQASAATIIAFTLAMFMISRAETLSRTSVVVTWMIMMFLLGFGRILYRLSREYGLFSWVFDKKQHARQVLLFPYNDTTEAFIRTARRTRDFDIQVAGIIDEHQHYTSRELQGKRVLGQISDISSIAKSYLAKDCPISELIVTDPSLTGGQMTSLLEACNDAGIKISRLPSLLDSASSRSGDGMVPKPVRLEDLLERPENKIDPKAISALVLGQVVVVSGAGGSIGSELCRQIATFSPGKLVLLELSEHSLYTITNDLMGKFPTVELVPIIADVRDQHRVSTIFEEHRPNVVFHAAALKHVPIVEQNPLEGIKTNVLGTVNLANAAISSNCRVFVMISTDKAVNPTNVMGATKRAAEAYCQSLDLSGANTHFVAVRFGNVLGSSGSVVPLFRQQIANGGPVTVTHPDVTRFFMTIPEAVRLVLQASSHDTENYSHRGKILVLDMGKPVKILDLARRMIQLAGFRPDIDISIEIAGLRPGEKLYEELHGMEENAETVSKLGFMVVAPRVIDRALLTRSIEGMKNACLREDAESALVLLRHIVPGYQQSDHIRSLLTSESETDVSKSPLETRHET